jgi:pilus assembly protein TadC
MRLPVTLLPGLALHRITTPLTGVASGLEIAFPFLKLHLRHADIKMSSAEYLAANIVSSAVFGAAVFAIALFVTLTAGLTPPLLISLGAGLIIAVLVWFQNLLVPKALIAKKVSSLERNLIPALSDMLVQLHSGIPLFDILVNIANGDYGAVSTEFKRAVRRISSGESQVSVLEELATGNPSVFFRRLLSQVVNALKTGASISSVLTDGITRLSDEQVIQIQKYGGYLNSLTMFYLMTAVIAPALLMTGAVVLSFFFSVTPFWTAIGFVVIYFMVVFIQVAFLGMLRTRRPNLL